MPELPEVETIKRGLEKLVIGQKIKRVEVLWSKSFDEIRTEVNLKVVGRKIGSLARRAKVLVIKLDQSQPFESSYALLIHLKMTGQLVLVRSDGERFAGGHPTESMERSLPDSSTRVIFTFESGDKLFFNDQRKFGWIKLVEGRAVKDDGLIKRLGPEPLSTNFTAAGLAGVVGRHRRAPIKAIILDQSTVSGIGNIYADESLHLARIHPARPGSSLSRAEIKRLHGAIKTIIELGIEHGGTSFTSYVNALGQKGDYLQQARVFRRQGQPCGVCGTVIEKIRVAGRGTHVCPQCQKLPRV